MKVQQNIIVWRRKYADERGTKASKHFSETYIISYAV
jgi:hypothetical protein